MTTLAPDQSDPLAYLDDRPGPGAATRVPSSRPSPARACPTA